MESKQCKPISCDRYLNLCRATLVGIGGCLSLSQVYAWDALASADAQLQWIDALWKGLWERAQVMNAGNWVILSVLMMLVNLSLITWWITAMKFWALRRVNRLNRLFLQRAMRASDWVEYIQAVEADRSCLARIALMGIGAVAECQGFKSLSKAPWMETREYVASAMRQMAQQVLQQQEKGSAVLASVGSIAPFVGLFGTVWGIMEALKTIGATGQASIDVVAGPVGEALIATAIGIAAAIPAVIFYNVFLRRQKLMYTQYESFIQNFLRLVLRFQVLGQGE